jgi:hypothetical protein
MTYATKHEAFERYQEDIREVESDNQRIRNEIFALQLRKQDNDVRISNLRREQEKAVAATPRFEMEA